jgi:hypothetical protein
MNSRAPIKASPDIFKSTRRKRGDCSAMSVMGQSWELVASCYAAAGQGWLGDPRSQGR